MIKTEDIIRVLHECNFGSITHTPIEVALSIQSLYKEQEGWISVQDRPKESGRYWCYCEEINSLSISHFQWNCCYNKENNTWTDNLKEISVTHWMPLPPAPVQSKPEDKNQ